MMRFKAALLAAAVTIGVPAMAMAQDRPDREDHRERGDHPDRGQRPGGDNGQQRPQQDQQRPPQMDQQRQMQDQQRQQAEQQQQQQAQQQQRQQQDQQRQFQDQQRRDQGRGNFGGQQPGFDRGRPDNRPDFNRGGRPDDRRPDFRPDDNRRPDLNRDPGFSRGPGGQPGFRGDDRRGGPPNRNWRQDRAFDWRGYRNDHREVFRAPRYVAPRGWGYGYRRFSIGIRIPNFFFGEQYWIDDPWSYRLPPAYGPYRWVRYYNDVLLIDLRTGEVIDEIPDFFW